MSSITVINAGDQITNSRTVINANFDALNNEKIETSVLDTDTALTANSDAKVATQKAVKTYVDAGGNVNASETAKGIVEEATDAEVVAGTATGGSGAKLIITPAKMLTSRYSPIKSVTAGATISGATLPVPVYQNKTDNEFYACDANDTSAMKFLGFAVSDSTDGNAMNVQFNGIVPGFTGLDEGEKYYLSDSVGTIQNSPGTREVLVGVAVSATELLIQRGRRYINGSVLRSDNGDSGTVQDTAVVCGFRPSIIRMAGFYDEADPSAASGSWVNGVYAGSGGGHDESAGGANAYVFTDGIVKIKDDAAQSLWTITIVNVTDTGFTVRATQDADTVSELSLSWTAEGEL